MSLTLDLEVINVSKIEGSAYTIKYKDGIIYVGGRYYIMLFDEEFRILYSYYLDFIVDGIKIEDTKIYVWGGYPLGFLAEFSLNLSLNWVIYAGIVFSDILLTSSRIFAVGGINPGFIFIIKSGRVTQKFYVGSIVYGIFNYNGKIYFVGGDYPAFIGTIEGTTVKIIKTF